MSAQSGKKKRWGSRRRGGNQSERSEPDEFHVKDSTSVVQANIPEENTESLNMLSNSDYSQLETKHPPSPELIGNRRKLGSSRRSKGRQHVTSVTEPYNKPREEVEENTSNETFEPTQMSLAIQPERHTELSQGNEHDILYVTHDSSLYSVTTPGYSSEVYNPSGSEVDLESLIPKNENLQAEHDQTETDCEVVSDSCKIMLGGTNKSDTLESAEVSDQVEQNAHHVGTSDFISSSLYLSSTVDQELIDQLKSREMPGEELPSVDSVTDTENKKRDDDTDLLRQDGNLQGNYLVSESYLKSEDIEFSSTPETTTDKSSFGENTEIENNVERATFSLPTEELSTNELNERFNLSEVKDDQHSEDAVNKEHKQEVKATQMQEMHQIDYSSESVIHDATEKSDTCPEILIDQAEIRDTYQSELSVKSSDDSVPKQEISNPDENQDEHHSKERNMEALDQRNEDDHVSNKRKMGSSRRNKGRRHIKDSVAESYHKPTEEVDHVSNTKEPWISNIAPCQVYEGEGQVEDDIKPSAEEKVHQVKEGIISEFEEGKSSLQNLQSEINAPLDSQPQGDSISIEEQTDSSLNPIGNRRKMGSSRRNKGKQHIKDSVAESYHKPTEEVVENMRGSEAFETTKISLATEPIWQEQLSQESEPEMTHDNSLYSATTPGYSSEVQNLTTTNHPETVLEGLLTKSENVQAHDDERETDSAVVSHVCKSVETMLEERDKSDTPQTEDISGQVKETSHLVGISALTSISVHSSSTADQQLNDQSNSREMSNEELPSLYSITDTENKERDDDTNMLRQDGILQVNYLTRESHVESEDVEFSTTPEVTTDKTSFGENTEIEYNVEQATFSLPTEELSTNEELNEHFNLPEVKDDQHSEDDLNKVLVQEDKPTQMQEMHQIDYASESVIHDATEKFDTCSENLIDQAEISDMYQSELSVKSPDDSVPKQEISNPDENQDEHHSKERNMEALDQRNEDDHVSNKRKMGSSRRNKGKRHIKDSVAESYHKPTEEVVENMRGSEAFETTKISLATEPVWQEELSQESEPEMTHDNSLYSATTPGYSSEVQNLTTTNHPETVLEGLLPESGNLQADDDERETDSAVVSHVCKSVETMLEERDKSDTPQTEDISDQVKETSHLVDISALTSISVHSSSTADQQLNEQSISREMSNEELPSVYSITDTENKERDDDTILLRQDGILQVNYLTCESHVESEDVEFSTTPEVTTDKTSFGENTEIEYNVERATFSLPTEVLSTNEELNEHFNLSEVKDDQLSEDAVNKEHKQEVKASQMQEMHQIDYSSENVIQDATEKSDTCSENLIDQAEIRDTYQSELSVKSSDDSVPKQEISNPDENQDEHHIKERNMEALDQRNEDDNVSNTKEPWISNIAPCQIYEGEGQVEDDIQPSVEEKVHQEREELLHKVEEREYYLQNLQSEINAPLDSQPQGDSISIEEQTDSSLNPIGNRRKMGSSRRNKGKRHIKDSVAESYHKPTEEVVENMRGSEAFETTKISLATEPVWQEELSQESEPEMTHDNSLYSATTPGYSSEVQNLTTTNHPETVLEGLLPKSENVQAHDDERKTDSTVVSDVCESIESMLEERDKSDTPQTEDISDQVKETSHLVDISALTSISVHSSSTADQQLNEQSISREMSNEELPSVYSITDTENKERDDDTNLLRQDGILQVNYLTCESHVESEDVEFSTTPEVTTDKTSFGENTEIEYNVERATFSLPTEVLSTNEELNEHFNLSEVKDDQLSEDAVNKEHKQEVKASQMQEMHQIDYSSENVIQDATEKSDTCSENLIDQAEIRDTYQSELSVKSSDDSVPKQEISNPDENQDEHHIKERNMEALDQRNEDDNVSNTKEPWISNIAPCQIYEGEGQVEDDIQPSVEEKVHQEREELLHKVEEREYYLQNLQSEINAPLDSQPQGDSISIEEQTDSSLNPIGNRRKMGSSRRNKGKRHIKDSVAESYHKPTEEVVENMRGSEAFETTKISLATEPVWQEELSQESEPEMTHDNSLYSATTPGYSSEVQNLTTTNHPETVLEGLLPKSENVQAHDDERKTDSTVVSDVCESIESMLEERDKSDTPQTEDISDQVKETSHLVDISALTSISVHSSSTADQQLNEQSISREMSNEELPSVYSITDTENKERDDDTNLLRQDGILQVNYLTCESHVESEDVEFSTTPEVTTDKTSFGENTEIEYNVERATFSLPTEVLSTNEELNEHFNLSEVKDDQLSEDAVNKEHKQEVKASQMQEMHQIDYSSENVIQDATEKSDTCSENLIDQAEIRDTYQSELSVKSSDDSVPKQEISNPDENQDEHHIKERNMEALDQRNEDDNVSNTKEPWISNIAPCQIYEGEGQVEDDIQPSVEEKVHQEREELLHKVEEREYYLQNLQSEINATLDSQPHGDSISIEEQTDSSLNPIGNRRKMGSSRRNKGKRHIKDSVAESYHKPTEEVVENMRGSEAVEKTKISLATEPVWQEELSQEIEPEMTHDNSLYSATTPGYSSEVQNLTTTNHPETVLEGLLPKSENVQAHDDERKTDSTVVSDVCESIESMLEERDKSDTPQTEDISDQVKETSHLVDISALTSISVHSSSTADQQLNDQSISREMSNEELPSVYSITDTENKERDDDTNLLRQDGILQVNYLTCESHVESEDVEFSTTPEVTTDKTSFGENTEIEYNVERATFSLPTEVLSTNEGLNEHFNLSEVKDDQLSEDAVNKEHKQEVKASQMQEMHQIDYSSENVIQDATEKSDTCSENLIDQAEIRDTYQSELSVKSTDDSVPKQEISNLDENQDEYSIEESNMQALNQRNEDDNVSNTKEPWINNIAPCQVYEGEGQVEDDIQPSAEETVHQVKEGILSEFEEGKSSLQTQQSEINATLDSQPHGDSISIVEQTDSSFNPIRNRRKMGSSRRNKGRRYIKDPAAESYYEPTEEVVENMRGSEAFETTKISLATEPIWQEQLSQESEPEMTHDNSLYSATTPGYSSEVQNLTTTNHPETVLEGLLPKSENVQAHDDERETDSAVVSDVCKSVETMLEERDKSDTPQTEDISDQVKETSRLVGISALTSISVHSSSTADQQLNEQSNSREMSNEELPSLYSITDTENKERDDDTNMLRQDGILQVNYLTRESHVESEDVEFSTTPEVTTDKTSFGENTEIEYNVEQATFSLPTEELSTNEELNEHFNLPEVKDDQLSEDAVNKEHKQEVKASQMQEMHQIDYSSESVIHDATEKSDTCPENLIDQAEIRDTYQSELSVKSTDDSATEQDISNPVDKQDDIQPSAEETVHQVKEGILSEFEEGKSSLQTQQSEINATLDSQPHGDSISIEEQTDSSFNPIRNRRKMGSSRRNKGRRYIKDPAAESYYEPTEEVVGNTRDNEILQAMKRSLIIEAPVEEKSVETMLEEMDKLDTSQTDEVSEQVKEMPNEELPNVYSVTYTENKERDEDTELLGHHGNLQGNYLVSESHVKSAKYHENTEIVYSVEKAMISSPNGRLSTNEEQNEHFILAEVRDAQHSEDTVNKVDEQGDKPTQMHEMDQTDHSSFKEGKSSLHTLQSGTHSPLGSLHQDDSVSIKEQTHTGVNPTVNRRKMGSSRRHKGRQPVKDFVAVSDMDLKDEVIENTWGDEAFETMKMSSATETTRQEEFKDQTDPGFEPTEDIRRICSTVNEEDNTQNMQEEGTILSENVKDDSVKSNEEVSENVDDAHKSQQETQENSDYSENLQIKPKQRRRKLASTRRDLIRKLGKEMDNKDETEESNLHAESDIRNLDKVEKVAEIPIVVTTDVSQNEKAKLSLSTVYEEQEMNEASTVQDQEQMGHSSTCEMHSTERNMISGLDDLMALLPEESASFSEEVVNAIKSFQVPQTDPGDRNVVVSVETPPVDDDKSTETFCETTQSDEKGPKDIKVIQGQDTNKKEALKQTTEAPGVAVADLEIVKSAIRGAEEGHKNVQDNIQEPKDVNEGAHNTNFEVKNSSPNVNQTNRRRKLGSSRRSQKKEVDNQATETNIGDAMTECVSGIKEKELQLQKEHKDGDSEPGKEKVFETVEYSHTGDSYTEPPSHQTVEENPAVSGHLVETEHHLTPEDIPVKLATSPKYDAMSELAYEGRRRKLGSHRKSHGHQTAREGRIIEAETGRDVKPITDKSGIKTLEENREESEVIESDKKPSSNISISKTGEPVSERISVQHHYAEVRLGQESQKSLSLADNYKGANRYNVVMIGDSSVGKTSFMKRAQSGKFSFDLPASVGLDSCLWNVVVDGKPVVLQLWDTAGQERFHSITRQIFHKAQAFLLIYDITSSESFFAVRYWVDCIKEGAMDDVTVLLLGNKSDCSERKVATQEGEILAKEYNFDFMECSAATGENVVQSLEIVARLLSQKVDTTKDAVVLRKEPQQKKASGCC